MNGSKVGCRRQQRDKHSKPSQQQIKSGTLQQYTPTHTVTGCPARGRACTAAATHMQGSTVKADAVCKRVRTLTAWPLAAALAAAAAAVVPPRLLLAAPLLIVGVVPGGSRVEEVREPPQRTDARGNRHGYSAGLAVERQVEVYKNHGIWGDNRGAEEGVCRGHASQPPIQRRAVGSERPERLRAQQRNRRRPRKGDRRRIVMWGGSAPFAWRKPAAEQSATMHASVGWPPVQHTSKQSRTIQDSKPTASCPFCACASSPAARRRCHWRRRPRPHPERACAPHALPPWPAGQGTGSGMLE